jgi:hypothetical protein
VHSLTLSRSKLVSKCDFAMDDSGCFDSSPPVRRHSIPSIIEMHNILLLLLGPIAWRSWERSKRTRNGTLNKHRLPEYKRYAEVTGLVDFNKK